jgi:predicted transcriptional regulator
MSIQMASSHPVEIDAETRARMERLAEARQQTVEEVLHDAVEQYAAREEKRGELLREGQTAWDDYLATGLHASGEEVDAWLARIEAGEDVPPPV